jgi:hypothetical protein
MSPAAMRLAEARDLPIDSRVELLERLDGEITQSERGVHLRDLADLIGDDVDFSREALLTCYKLRYIVRKLQQRPDTTSPAVIPSPPRARSRLALR